MFVLSREMGRESEISQHKVEFLTKFSQIVCASEGFSGGYFKSLVRIQCSISTARKCVIIITITIRLILKIIILE